MKIGLLYGLILFYACAFAQIYNCEAVENLSDEPVIEGQNGWLYDSFDFTDTFRFGRTMTYLNRLIKALEYHKIQLVMVLIPTRAMVNYKDFDLSKPIFNSYLLEKAVNSYSELLKELEKKGRISSQSL